MHKCTTCAWSTCQIKGLFVCLCDVTCDNHSQYAQKGDVCVVNELAYRERKAKQVKERKRINAEVKYEYKLGVKK